ncbi:MAG: 4-amino-4-deoxy-L-arabinose transferase-like glycosyltransferase [Chitinophagales bacterium]|jgi:4-amino-4-deoxy-L-arabinose transferase-like glycosyltransferase
MQDSPSSRAIFSASTFYLLLIVSFFISFLGLFIPIMEVDASQYASMSLELWQRNSLLQLTDLGEAYLDKPPLLFWLSGLSISLFGHSSFAFKLPSFLMAWFSVYGLYQFSKLYYKEEISRLAALVYACTVAFLLFTNDIRTDTLMISLVVLTVWQGSVFLKTNQIKALFLATVAVSFAMLAKGPIGLVVPLLAIGPQLLLKKEWKSLLRWEIILLPIIIFLVLSPMLIGLYQQWGFHGIQFFFWEQSFGRITGENVWENEATYFYFLHNIVWAVLPFTLFFILGIINTLSNWKSQKEYISFFGLVLPFIALSLSHYKLPHYIYVVVPFASILIAKAIYHWLENNIKYKDLGLYFIQFILIAAILILPILIFTAFPASILMYGIYLLGALGVFFIFYLLQFQKQAFILASFSAFLLGAFIINTHAYPSLLKYQGSSEAAMYIAKEDYPAVQLYQHQIWWRAFHYYSGGPVQDFHSADLSQHDAFVLTTQDGFDELSSSYSTEVLHSFPHFNVTRLSLDFLNPSTRPNKLKTLYLIKIQKKL